MKVLDVEGITTHDGPESCGHARKGRTEALTGVRVGRVLSRESHVKLLGADPVEERGRQYPLDRYREGRRDPARSETPCMRARTSCGNREVPRLARMDGVQVRKGNLREKGYRR